MEITFEFICVVMLCVDVSTKATTEKHDCFVLYGGTGKVELQKLKV
jgi:hypothetical protein